MFGQVAVSPKQKKRKNHCNNEMLKRESHGHKTQFLQNAATSEYVPPMFGGVGGYVFSKRSQFVEFLCN